MYTLCMQENRQFLPLAVIVAGVLIAGAIYFGGSTQTPLAQTSNPSNTATAAASIDVASVSGSDHVLGDPSTAKVTIIEYSDLECPFCKIFHSTLHEIVNEYGNQVSWVFRQFPIVQLHSKAPNEAAASECVAELGGNDAFWKFIDQVFATTNSNDSLDPSQLPVIAQGVGVDLNAFTTCLSSGKYTTQIQNDVQAAIKAGAQGTPYTVLVTPDGKKVPISGAQPIETVKAQIDSLLKG